MKKIITITSLLLLVAILASCNTSSGNNGKKAQIWFDNLDDFKIYVESQTTDPKDFKSITTFPPYNTLKKSAYVKIEEMFSDMNEFKFEKIRVYPTDEAQGKWYSYQLENQIEISLDYDKNTNKGKSIIDVQKQDEDYDANRYKEIEWSKLNELDDGGAIVKIGEYTLVYWCRNGIPYVSVMCIDGFQVSVNIYNAILDYDRNSENYLKIDQDKYAALLADETYAPIMALFSENTEARDAAFYKIVSAVQNRPYKDVQ